MSAFLEILSQITFSDPYFFLLLILYIIALYFFENKRDSFYFSNLGMFPKEVFYKSYFMKVLKFLIIFFMIVALANPVKEDQFVVHNDKGYEISIVLDASISMLENKKFIITKEILEEFIQKRKNDKIALSVFADYPYLLSPLTSSKEGLLQHIKFLDVGIAGVRETSIYEALFFSANLFKGSLSKHKIVILLTDGIDNTNRVPLHLAIQKAKDVGMKVYSIGIGGVEDFNKDALEQIASQTGGKFFHAKNKKDLKGVYETIDTLEKSEMKTNSYKHKKYYYQYPLFISFGLLVLFLILRGRTL